MSDKLITLSDQATVDELGQALYVALKESCGGVIDRYPDGTPAAVQTTTRATGPLPATVDDDGKVLVPEDPLTLVIDARCESFHGSVVHVELAPEVAAVAVVEVAVDAGGKPLPPETKDGKIEQPVLIMKPDGKGGVVVVDGKTVDGVLHEKYEIDLSAAVPMQASSAAGEVGLADGMASKLKAAARAATPSGKSAVIAIGAGAVSGAVAAAGLMHAGADSTTALIGGAAFAIGAATLALFNTREKKG